MSWLIASRSIIKAPRSVSLDGPTGEGKSVSVPVGGSLGRIHPRPQSVLINGAMVHTSTCLTHHPAEPQTHRSHIVRLGWRAISGCVSSRAILHEAREPQRRHGQFSERVCLRTHLHVGGQSTSVRLQVDACHLPIESQYCTGSVQLRVNTVRAQ